MIDIWEIHYSIPFLTNSTVVMPSSLFIPPTAKRPRRRHLGAPPFVVEYVFDTTRAIVNLIFTGTLRRYPDIRVIVAHGGGAVPYLAQRISMLEGHRKAPEVADVIPQLRALYYEIASTTAGYALRSLQELADPNHVLWGSDLPFVYGERLQEEVDHWEAYDGFNADERMAVEQQNASVFFRAWLSVTKLQILKWKIKYHHEEDEQHEERIRAKTQSSPSSGDGTKMCFLQEVTEITEMNQKNLLPLFPPVRKGFFALLVSLRRSLP